MSATPIHDAEFLTIWWDETTRTIGIDWKQATAGMSAEQFKTELTLFASHVEKHKARGILVDVSRFRHKMAPEVQQWRLKHISSRYNAAGVQRFAFLLPSASRVPSMMNQSSPGEQFATRGFTDVRKAKNWLGEAEQQHSAAWTKRFGHWRIEQGAEY